MALYLIQATTHKITIGGLVDKVVLEIPCENVRIINRGATDIFVRFDGVDPTVGGDDTHVVRAGTEATFGQVDATMAEVRLISTLALAYTVECI